MAADRLRVGLRLRVTAVAVLTVGTALAVSAMLLVGLVRSRLDTAATTAATLRASDVAALAEAGTLPTALALPGEESAFVQVVDESGAVIASTGNIEGEPAVSTVKPSGMTPLVLTTPIDPLDQADAMRVVALNTTTSTGTVTVYAGETETKAYKYTTPAGDGIRNHRQKMGKGIKDRYFAIGAAGTGPLSLDNAEFDVHQLTRRI